MAYSRWSNWPRLPRSRRNDRYTRTSEKKLAVRLRFAHLRADKRLCFELRPAGRTQREIRRRSWQPLVSNRRWLPYPALRSLRAAVRVRELALIESAAHAVVSCLVAHPDGKTVSRWLAGWQERSGYPTLAPTLSGLFYSANSGRSVCAACCLRPAALLPSAKGYSF